LALELGLKPEQLELKLAPLRLAPEQLELNLELLRLKPGF
jgi:hypothetical protein